MIIGAFAILMAAVMVCAVPVADVSAADDDVAIAVTNTDDGINITFSASYEGADRVASVATITEFAGVLTFAENKTVGDLPASIAGYVGDVIVADDGNKTAKIGVPTEIAKDIVEANTDIATVEWKTVKAVVSIADVSVYTAEQITAIEDAVKASFEGFVSADDAQTAIDEAVAQAIADYKDANPVVVDNSLMAWCVAALFGIAAAFFGFLTILGYRADKRAGRNFI